MLHQLPFFFLIFPHKEKKIQEAHLFNSFGGSCHGHGTMVCRPREWL